MGNDGFMSGTDDFRLAENFSQPFLFARFLQGLLWNDDGSPIRLTERRRQDDWSGGSAAAGSRGISDCKMD